MFERVKSAVVPHLIGLVIMGTGWYISILNVGLSRFQDNMLFTKWTLIGLILIIIGAYLPEIWIGLRKKS